MTYLERYDSVPGNQVAEKVGLVSRWIGTDWQPFFKELRENRPLFVTPAFTLVPIRVCGAYFGFPGPNLETMLRWAKSTQSDMFKNLQNVPAGFDDHRLLANMAGLLIGAVEAVSQAIVQALEQILSRSDGNPSVPQAAATGANV
jgi:cytochrome P450